MTEPSALLRVARHHGLVVVAAWAMVLLAACGSSDSGSSDSGTSGGTQQERPQEVEEVSPDRVLAGVVREPAPVVDETPIPSLTNEGDDVVFRAQPDGLQVVYFGYTNCPDVCPTTMFDHTVSLRLLPDDMADQVDTVMVTVDPDRDLDLLTGYVQSFVPDGEAAGTSDPPVLAAAAEPFGVSYDVVEASDGSIEVSHSGFLYVVSDNGELLLAWPFGTSSEEMATDMVQLLTAEGT
jgi:protein SCO1/2